MDQPISILPDPALAASGDILLTDVMAALALDDPIATRAALLAAREGGLDLASERTVLGELVARALVWFDTGALVIPALDALAALDESAALAAFDLVFATLFPDGKVDADGITNAAVVLLTRLLGAAGHADDARGFLISSRGKRDPSRFLPLVHAAWCHLRGVDSALAALWPPLAAWADPDGSLAEPGTWRAIARVRAQAEDWVGALDALATAMTLPMPDHAKAGVGADFAVIALWLLARGQEALFVGVQRYLLALATAPGLAREATLYLSTWPEDTLHAVYDPGLRVMLRDWLHGFAATAPLG